MPPQKTHVPKLCRHATGQAFVKVNGQQRYLGVHGDPATQERYDRFVAEWLQNGRRLPAAPEPPQGPATVSVILAAYLRSIQGRYSRSEYHTIGAVAKILRRLFGSTNAEDFGPNNLRTCRAEMVRMEWSRSHINKQISRLRSIFRWAVSHELIREDSQRSLGSTTLTSSPSPRRTRIAPSSPGHSPAPDRR